MYICSDCLKNLENKGYDYRWVKTIPYESTCDTCKDYGIVVSEIINIKKVEKS